MSSFIRILSSRFWRGCVCLPFWESAIGGLLLTALGTTGAEIPVTISNNDFTPPVIAIDAGDTVTWSPVDAAYYSIHDFYGQWAGPIATNSSQTFSKTFSKPGFYPVLSGWGKARLQAQQETATGIGTIMVLPWTNNPPEVRINWPVDGFIFSSHTPSLVNLVTTYRMPLTDIARVDLLSNSKVVWTATNAPFALSLPEGTNITAGTYSLQARVAEEDGTLHLSAPVRIVIGPGPRWLSEPRVLRDGSFLCYRSSLRGGPDCVIQAHTPQLEGRGGPTVGGNGVFVDATARTNQALFYTIVFCP